MPEVIKSRYKFEAPRGGTLIVTTLDTSDNSVSLCISSDAPWFWAEDIKELRKFLKKLQKQLEGNT